MFTWLESLSNWLIYDVLLLDMHSHLAASLQFFIYDSIKILILLVVIVTVMTFVTQYFPVARIKHFLTTRKLYGFQYLFAALFGVITPFCSCSAIPLFIGFLKSGIPLGVTLTFLITSPMVNEVAIALLAGTL